MALPDCMMPDGAEPCGAYRALQAELARVRDERDNVNRALAEAHDKYAKQAKMLIEGQERVARRAALLARRVKDGDYEHSTDEAVAQAMREEG